MKFMFFVSISISLLYADIYYTWPGIEVDKCASVWLIQKFVDQNAEFRIIEKGDSVVGAIPFDIPNAEFGRKHGKTTFDMIMEKYSLNDPALNRIALIVKDAEINVWAEKKMEETTGVQRIILGIDELFDNDLEAIKASNIIFNALYSIYSQ